MINRLSDMVVITDEGNEIPSDELLLNEKHFLKASVDNNHDIHLRFSSRQALYDFAKSLLQESVFGKGGQKEFYPLILDGKALVVDGARLVEDSSRIFVTYE